MAPWVSLFIRICTQNSLWYSTLLVFYLQLHLELPQLHKCRIADVVAPKHDGRYQ
jgi:hypothetical protein